MKIAEKLIKNKGLINAYKFSKLQLIHNFNIIFFKKLYFFFLKNKNCIYFNKKKLYNNHYFFTYIRSCENFSKKKEFKFFFKKILDFINLYFYKET